MRRLQAAYRGFRGRRAALEILVALRRRRRAVRCDMAGKWRWVTGGYKPTCRGYFSILYRSNIPSI